MFPFPCLGGEKAFYEELFLGRSIWKQNEVEKDCKSRVAWLHISCNVVIDVDSIIGKKAAFTHPQPTSDFCFVLAGKCKNLNTKAFKYLIDFNFHIHLINISLVIHDGVHFERLKHNFRPFTVDYCTVMSNSNSNSWFYMVFSI